MVVVHTISPNLNSNVKINLDVVTYLPYISFTDDAVLPSLQYGAQHKTALSCALRCVSHLPYLPLSPGAVLTSLPLALFISPKPINTLTLFLTTP